MVPTATSESQSTSISSAKPSVSSASTGSFSTSPLPLSADRSPLRALLVEDNPDDAALVLHALRRGGYDVEHLRVETADDLRNAVARGSWDVVIADYNLPAFTGPQAFVIARQERKDLPFILVSGAVGEETVVEAMRQGIDDYL